MRRLGHTYRIHDFRVRGRLLVVALDPEARGGFYNPEVHIHWNRGRGYIGGHSLRIRIPVLGFARAYRLRRLGMLRLYRIEARIIYRLFT